MIQEVIKHYIFEVHGCFLIAIVAIICATILLLPIFKAIGKKLSKQTVKPRTTTTTITYTGNKEIIINDEVK